MKTKNIMLMALSGLAVTGLTGCGEGEDGNPGFFQRFYNDFIAGLLGEQPVEARKGMPPLPVSVMKLQQQTVPVYATWFGSLRGMEQTDIKPEVAGKIVKQVYINGSPCEEGETLFLIDDVTYKAAVEMAAANLEAAEAAAKQAEVADAQAQQDVDRYSGLVKSGSISEKTYTDALHQKNRTAAALAVTKANVKQARAALTNAQINLDRCTIKAPFKGYASAATVSVGDHVSPGVNVLTRMSAIDPIRVDFMVTGKHVLDIVTQTNFKAGQNMEAPFTEFDVFLEDGSLYSRRGVVKTMDSEVNSSTGTVNFIGEIPNDELRLRSGASVQVRAKIGEVKDAFLVPKGALLSSMNHRFIYVVGKDMQPYGIDVILGPEIMLDMPNGDGTTVKMPMQVVTARPGTNEKGEPRGDLAAILRDLGYDNPLDVPVIVEGGQMAQIYATANMGMKKQGIPAGFGVIAPNPRAYVYTPAYTTTPSVTAKPSRPAAPQK
ncbi:MAG: efflux RND transporter periplasmic adaptor subunit [Akkermansia sp.]|nr:efflux RND transporter periplasmic adaptor subunit [Akkermansia sp.]